MKSFRTCYDNFIEVFSNWKHILISIITLIIIGSIFAVFTEDEIIKGNLGVSYYFINSLLQILITILFAIFVPISIHKIQKFSKFSVSENSSSTIATFLGVLVAGCPACSISIASYIGLAGVVALLPYHGLELKLIAVPLLVYAIYSILKDLNLCKIRPKKK